MSEPGNWYEELAKANTEREKCVNAINRWTEALRRAEARMAELAASAPVPTPNPDVIEATATATISAPMAGMDMNQAAEPSA